MRTGQKIFGLVGWSGSGKTTLVVKLVPALMERGLSISTMKHTHHNFDVDKPGKDSFEHRAAGATEVMLTSSKRWVLQHELRDEPESDMDELVARMSPVDLVLIEGFKRDRHQKMEVFRREVGKPLLAPEDSSIAAVASDGPVPEVSVPVIDLNDLDAIADFIFAHCGFGAERVHGAA